MSLAAVQPAKPKAQPNDPVTAVAKTERAESPGAEVAGLPRYLAIQPKLAVGAPDDPFEKEADRVADHVMRMPEPDGAGLPFAVLSVSRIQRRCAACSGPIEEPEDGMQRTIQRKCAACAAAEKIGTQFDCDGNDEDKSVQRRADTAANGYESGANGHDGSRPLAGKAADRIRALQGGGAPLSRSARNYFEPRFGHDFGAVRIHTGGSAAESARELGAQAYTLGRDIVFGSGRFAPTTHDGRRLLAHELTHVVQQSRGQGQAPRLIQRSPGPLDEGSTLKTGADLDSNDPTVRATALRQLARRVDEEGWRALLLAQDSRHDDIRTESEQIIRSRFGAEPRFADYVRTLARAPRGALSDLAIRVLARTGAGAVVPLEDYRNLIHQRFALARLHLAELDDTLYALISAATKGPLQRDPMQTTEIDQLEIEVDALGLEDLWEVGLRASTLLDQISQVKQAVQQLLPAAAQFDQDHGMRRLIQSQLLKLLLQVRNLTGMQDDPAYAEIAKTLGSFPATFAAAIVEQLHAHFSAARAQIRKQFTPQRMDSEGGGKKQEYQRIMKEVVQPIDADLTLFIQELETLRLSAADYPEAVFARLDALEPILRSIGERALYLQQAGSMLDLYADLKATNAYFGDDPETLYDKALKLFFDFESLAEERDKYPESSRKAYDEILGSRYADLMKQLEEWQKVLEYRARNDAIFGAILNLFIIIISIETGGLAGGLVRGLFGNAVTLGGRIAVGTLAFGADVTAFTATSRGLRWGLYGSAGERSFSGELVENALLFAWLKGSGKVYERFVRGFKGLSPTVKAIGSATTTFLAFQAWAVAMERRDTGAWVTPLDQRFWELAGQNALFLAAVHLGRPLVEPLSAGAKSATTRFWINRHNARCLALGERIDAWQRAAKPDSEGAVSILRRSQALYQERIDVLRQIHQLEPTELTSTELSMAEGVLRSQIEAIDNAIFQARLGIVAHESLPDTFYYDGDPVTVRDQYERQGYEFVEVDDATGRMRLKAPDGRVVDLIRTRLERLSEPVTMLEQSIILLGRHHTLKLVEGEGGSFFVLCTLCTRVRDLLQESLAKATPGSQAATRIQQMIKQVEKMEANVSSGKISQKKMENVNTMRSLLGMLSEAEHLIGDTLRNVPLNMPRSFRDMASDPAVAYRAAELYEGYYDQLWSSRSKIFPGRKVREDLVKALEEEAAARALTQAQHEAHGTPLELAPGAPARTKIDPSKDAPFGFYDRADFEQFSHELNTVLASGAPGAQLVMEGSAVTGRRFERLVDREPTGQPFGFGRMSDYDIAIVSDALFETAKRLRLPMGGGAVPGTKPLSPADLGRLGLGDLDAAARRAILDATGLAYPVNFKIRPAGATPQLPLPQGGP
jgi:hypothetical protein